MFGIITLTADSTFGSCYVPSTLGIIIDLVGDAVRSCYVATVLVITIFFVSIHAGHDALRLCYVATISLIPTLGVIVGVVDDVVFIITLKVDGAFP